MTRFDLRAKTHTEAETYLRNRALQIAHTGAKLISVTNFEEGVWAEFEYMDETMHSLYLLDQYRGSGKFYTHYYQKCTELNCELKMLTTSACGMAPYFKHKKIPHMLANGLTNTAEYKLTASIYGDKTATRSGVFLMNHIDEGLYVLNSISATYHAKLGYILHPVFQENAYLETLTNVLLMDIDPMAIVMAMEYRAVANAYLSGREIESLDDIALSPLKAVNEMLIADKVQNRKDFEIYHEGTHARSAILSKYFKNWLEKLNVSEEQYRVMKDYLTSITMKLNE